MPTADVEARLREALPVWARTAQVSVTNGAGGERRASITHDLPAAALSLADAHGLARFALGKQFELNGTGANVGTVTIKVRDPLANQPLWTFAGDATWGQQFSWISPLIKHAVPVAANGPVLDPVNDATDTATQAVDDAAALLP